MPKCSEIPERPAQIPLLDNRETALLSLSVDDLRDVVRFALTNFDDETRGVLACYLAERAARYLAST